MHVKKLHINKCLIIIAMITCNRSLPTCSK